MTIWKSLLLAGTMLATCSSAWAGQAPGALSSPAGARRTILS